MAATRVKPRDKGLTHGRALALERMLKEDAILYPQYRDHNGCNVILAKAANKPFSFERSDTAYSKTLDFLPSNWKGAAIESIGGKTLCWNQLCNNSTATSTDHDVAFTNNGDGSWTVNGTATGSWGTKNANTYIKIINGHKYFYCGCPTGGSSSTYFLMVNGVGGEYDIGGGNIGTAVADSNYGAVQMQVKTGTTVTNIVYKPRLIDLTLMFGAGNEPSTVAEFQAMFPAIDPAYDAGTLKSAGVTGAVSRGKNLATYAGTASTTSGTTIVEFSTPVTFENLTVSFQCTGVTYGAGGSALITYVTPTENVYTVPGSMLKENGINWSSTMPAYTGRAYNIKNNITITRIVIHAEASNWAQISGTISDIQIEASATMTSYTPYRSPITLPVPAAVQALPGYGWSAGKVCNEVDWVNKKYIQRVGSVDLGTLSWGYNSSYGFYGNPSGFPAPPKFPSDLLIAANILCQKYPTTYVNAIVAGVKTNVIGLGGSYLYVGDTSYTDAATFKSAMSGVMLYYELETPVITDISSLLSDDNLLPVEPGGTVTFENALGDGYRIPVPTKVKYQRRGTDN